MQSENRSLVLDLLDVWVIIVYVTFRSTAQCRLATCEEIFASRQMVERYCLLMLDELRLYLAFTESQINAGFMLLYQLRR